MWYDELTRERDAQRGIYRTIGLWPKWTGWTRIISVPSLSFPRKGYPVKLRFLKSCAFSWSVISSIIVKDIKECGAWSIIIPYITNGKQTGSSGTTSEKMVSAQSRIAQVPGFLYNQSMQYWHQSRCPLALRRSQYICTYRCPRGPQLTSCNHESD